MKWFKVPSTFFQSKTAQLLHHELGADGPLVFLKLISIISTEINCDEDIAHLIENGWTKPEKQWREMLQIRSRKWIATQQLLSSHGVLGTQKVGIFLTLRIKNIAEFIEPRAISSKLRPKAGSLPGSLKSRSWDAREEKRRKPPTPLKSVLGSAVAPPTFEGSGSAARTEELSAEQWEKNKENLKAFLLKLEGKMVDGNQ